MNIFAFVWNTIFYFPIINLLVLLYKYLGNNLGIAVILLTIIIRIILWPLMKSQIDSMKKLQAVQPKINELKEKYKKDKKKFQEAQMKLYRESGINPLGSCLPLLLQVPFLYSIYFVITAISKSANASVFNNVVYFNFLKLSPHLKYNTIFLGINLSKNAGQIGFHNLLVVSPYILLAILVGVSQYFASKVSLPETIAETTEAVEEIEEIDEIGNKRVGRKKKKAANKRVSSDYNKGKKKKDTNELDPEQFSKAIQTQMLYLFPVLTTWLALGISAPIPAAVSIYWIVQSLAVVVQTLFLQNKLKWKKQK